jgi:hypothetical protein
VLALAAMVLTAAAWLRGAEYDEQYTLFLTAGTARPVWPATVFPAGAVATMQAGHTTFAAIARDLRATDVHPPLYFWVASIWRSVFGPTLFAARMLSVLFGVVSVWLVGVIARRCDIRPAPAMLITLGCYGFVYTNAIARGFALAETLTLAGVALLLVRRFVIAGVCLGAACCCNYLAVFVGVAAVAVSGAWAAIPAAMPFLALDAWFFFAQHASRDGQFPPFSLWGSLVRLIQYQGAAVFGGLPLYFGGVWQIFAGSALGLVSILLVFPVVRARPWAGDFAIRLVVAAAIAPAAGLLALGAVFNNTPIELRYLSFGLPFVALLLALPFRGWNARIGLLLAVQLCGVAGLLLSSRTMQPAQAAARDAERLGGGAVVVVPSGNDGVGIVGAFGISALPTVPVLVVWPSDPILMRLEPFDLVAVAVLAQDRDSIAVLAGLHSVLVAPVWRRVAGSGSVEVFRRCSSC